MILPIIVGQAPSRLGDGRAFTGPSGDRLVKWAGVANRDELLRYFRLANLMSEPLPHHPENRKPNGNLKPVNFSMKIGRLHAEIFMGQQRDYLYSQLGVEGAENFLKVRNHIDVVLLGKKVWESFELHGDTPMFGRIVRSRSGLRFHRFPHPSGLNHQMNDWRFVKETSERLRRIGCIITAPDDASA